MQTENAVLNERLSQQLVDINTLKNQHETRLKQAYDEKHIAHEQDKKMQIEMRQLQQQLQTQAEKYQTEITRERQRQEESENRWLTQIDQARTELQHVRKESERIISKQSQQIELLTHTINEVKETNIASNFTLKGLEKINTELNHKLKICENRYHEVLTKIPPSNRVNRPMKEKKYTKNKT